MKTCKTCKLSKPLIDFSKDSRRKDGLSIYCRLCNAAKYRDHYNKQTPEQRKRTWNEANIRRHGITVAEYDALLSRQNGVCAICLGDSGSRRFNIDHDHNCCPELYSCGKCVRGLLCGSCNKAIGLLREDKSVVLRVLEYL